MESLPIIDILQQALKTVTYLNVFCFGKWSRAINATPIDEKDKKIWIYGDRKMEYLDMVNRCSDGITDNSACSKF